MESDRRGVPSQIKTRGCCSYAVYILDDQPTMYEGVLPDVWLWENIDNNPEGRSLLGSQYS